MVSQSPLLWVLTIDFTLCSKQTAYDLSADALNLEGKNSMIVTPLYAGALALWFLVLSIKVIRYRGHGISLGDGGDPNMLRLIRGHANFAEYVPLILVMMAMLELSHYPYWLLHVFGATLLVARVLHGISLSFTQHWKFGRFYGTALTFLLLLIVGGLCLWQGVRGLMVLPAVS